MQADIDGSQVGSAIALLYGKYAAGLLGYARMHVASQEDAEDLVVEVFLAAIENAQFVTLPEKTQELWLWRVARNKVIDVYRRAKTRQSVSLDQMTAPLFEDEVFSPEYAALRQEDYIDLYAHLRSLPAPQQEILRLRFGLGLSCGEIATRLGKQENAVRVALSRSLNLLRGIYGQKGGSIEMTYQDEFFTPDEVDEQIQRVSQFKAGDQADAEALAYLRSLYHNNARQEGEALNRMWNRIAGAASSAQSTPNEPMKGMIIPMQTQRNQQTHYSVQPGGKRRASLAQRLGVLAAAVFLIILVGSMAIVFYSVRHQQGAPASGSPTPAHKSTPTPISTSAPVPLKVTSVDMAVNPTSIAGMQCGTNVIVTYTATFHVVPNSAGGVVNFDYTISNGRGITPASITFDRGETTRTYAFKWSGALPLDHTYPERGGVIVTSPNSVSSPLVGPTGACSPAAFKVTSVSMAVSPTSIAGMKCGTNVTVTYTATFHVAPDSNGGTVRFMYTVNNGRGSTPANLTFAPGDAVMTYSFTWSGVLPADHTYPGQGGVMVTSPNALTSALVAPTGQCS